METDVNVHLSDEFCLLFFFTLQKCDEIIVLHLGYLNYTQYQVAVSFKGLENITYEIKVKFVVSKKTLVAEFKVSDYNQ